MSKLTNKVALVTAVREALAQRSPNVCRGWSERGHQPYARTPGAFRRGSKRLNSPERLSHPSERCRPKLSRRGRKDCRDLRPT